MHTRTDARRGTLTGLPLLALLVALPLGAAAQDHSGHHMDGMEHGDHAADSAAVAEVVGAFHAALASGDSATATSLMAPDARVLEGASIETLEQYAGHHLPADMAFAAAVPRERGPMDVFVRGDVAWTVSTSTAKGTYRDRDIDSKGAELVVLARHDGMWRIQAIQWSSR